MGTERESGAEVTGTEDEAGRDAPGEPGTQEIADYAPLAAPELDRLLALVHPNPHAILGAHPTKRGALVRAFRPAAERVLLLIEGEPPRELHKIHPRGLFEILLAEKTELFPYHLEVHYPNGNVYTLRDPYAFLPTLGEMDQHLFNEGRHERIYQKLGSHLRDLGGVGGVSFAVWAPHARGVSVVGDFNDWDGRLRMMRALGVSGVWELFIPGLEPGALYKYEIRTRNGDTVLKADPYAFRTEMPPRTASVVYQSAYQFQDQDWMAARAERDLLRQPLSIYEVHVGSWRHVDEAGGTRPLTYRELAPVLADYVAEMGFTHVEFLPLKGHPFGGSWGYQVSSYYAPTPRYGTPDDFRFLVDHLHGRGIGVILDWVPAHFPKDAWALGRFDGTPLYEYADPREGEHPDWGTFIFNFGRNEVRNFLLSNALFWIAEFHIDGLRCDAVTSMLRRDYSRQKGDWIPNKYGGPENLEAMALIRELNEIVHERYPGVLMIAEESTSWPGVSRPLHTGGLGFSYKWNLGWMHDTLDYFAKDPVYRRFFHERLTFGIFYAWSENFILPLSHDEVVHMKGSLLNKMPGRREQRFANLRALFAHMWAHPGKQLLFMGGEFGQWREWDFDASLDWHLLAEEEHSGLQKLVRDLNRLYRQESALWEADTGPEGFQWIDHHSAEENVIAYRRIAPTTGAEIICIFNFSAVMRAGYRVGLPWAGKYREVLNTDAAAYGGSNAGNLGAVEAEPIPHHGLPFSAAFVLPPLTGLWFAPPALDKEDSASRPAAKS